MQKSSMHNINLSLAGRTYSVSVSAEEEADIRALTQDLNQEFEDLRQRYRNRVQTQDILSMMLLERAKKLREVERHDTLGPALDLQPLHQCLDDLDNLLDELLPPPTQSET